MRVSTLLLGVLTLTTLFSGSAALARDYVVEVVLFENMFSSGTVSTPSLYIPRSARALNLGSDSASNANFVAIDQELQLTANADSIRDARSYRLLKHFAWQQPGLDAESAQAIKVGAGSTFKVFIPEDYQIYPDFIPATQSQSLAGGERQITSTLLNGTLKVRLGRFLHLDAKLVFTDTETATSYRMHHSRKMRSRELHYIDNPKFGMLVKILPVPE